MSRPIKFSDFIGANTCHNELWRSLLSGLCDAAVEVAAELSCTEGKLTHGANGNINAQGEWQQCLDVFAEDRFIHHLEKSKACCLVLSEEQREVIRLPKEPGECTPPYLVALDPLDGSSNISVNVPVGSIFSIYKRKSPDGPVTTDEVLRRGDEQLAAGYFLYGTSTMLVYACNGCVNGFTLDTTTNEFLLSHPGIRIPADGTIYAVNDANYPGFTWGARNFLRYCRQQAETGDRPFTARYSGSMVSDIHRVLLCGGIFLYPGTLAYPNGKLRLAYECFPIAYIMEMAGGLAIDGSRRLLEQRLDTIHQRSPIVTGSVNLVVTAQRFINTTIPATYELDIQTG